LQYKSDDLSHSFAKREIFSIAKVSAKYARVQEKSQKKILHVSSMYLAFPFHQVFHFAFA